MCNQAEGLGFLLRLKRKKKVSAGVLYPLVRIFSEDFGTELIDLIKATKREDVLEFLYSREESAMVSIRYIHHIHPTSPPDCSCATTYFEFYTYVFVSELQPPVLIIAFPITQTPVYWNSVVLDFLHVG